MPLDANSIQKIEAIIAGEELSEQLKSHLGEISTAIKGLEALFGESSEDAQMENSEKKITKEELKSLFSEYKNQQKEIDRLKKERDQCELKFNQLSLESKANEKEKAYYDVETRKIDQEIAKEEQVYQLQQEEILRKKASLAELVTKKKELDSVLNYLATHKE